VYKKPILKDEKYHMILYNQIGKFGPNKMEQLK
jgi:hypothetical protein